MTSRLGDRIKQSPYLCGLFRNKTQLSKHGICAIRITESVGNDGNILIGSLNGGEVGAPEIDTFDDAEAFEAAGLGDIFGIPGFE